jgi:hypothetical protein
MTNDPIPFRSRAQRHATQKALATRRRRRELLAIAHAKRPLTNVSAPTLEWLYWDVRDWVRTLPRDHANLAMAADLEVRIDAEYARRHQETPALTASRQVAEAIDRMLSRDAPPVMTQAARPEPPRLIPFPVATDDDGPS